MTCRRAARKPLNGSIGAVHAVYGLATFARWGCLIPSMLNKNFNRSAAFALVA